MKIKMKDTILEHYLKVHELGMDGMTVRVWKPITMHPLPAHHMLAWLRRQAGDAACHIAPEQNNGWYIAATVGIIMLCFLMCGCTTERVVTVESVRTDTLRQSRNILDSVYVHDSVSVREKGDTVMVERWHTAWRDRWRHDSIYISTCDTVAVPYDVEKVVEVEKRLTWWQQTRIHVGGIVIFGLIVLAGWKFLLPLLRKKFF